MHSQRSLLLVVVLCALYYFASEVCAQENSNYPSNAINTNCCIYVTPETDDDDGFYFFVAAPPARAFECKEFIGDRGFRNWPDITRGRNPFTDVYVDPNYSGHGYEGTGCAGTIIQTNACSTLAGYCAEGTNLAAVNNVALLLETDYTDSATTGPVCRTTNIVGTTSVSSFIRTWISRQACPLRGQITATQLIEIHDNEPPQLSIPADITLECSTDSSIVRFIGNADAFDTCYPVGVAAALTNVGGNNCARTEQYTWTATEQGSACELTSQAVQTVTIVDTTPPDIQQLPSYTLQCSVPLNIPAVTPTVTDACFLGNNFAASLTATDNRIDGPCAGTYTVERTWSASDACGNIGSQVQYIFVEDVTPPTFTGYVPADTFTRVNCFQDIAANLQSLSDLFDIAIDDCTGTATDGGVSVVEDRYVENDGSVNAVDNINYVQEFTATDGCGNSVSWANRFAIASNSPITQTLALTGPATATKGVAFNVDLQYTPVPACGGQESRTAVTVDAGAATFTTVTGAGCVCTQQATGTVFCNNVPSGTCSLSFTVPTTFLPNSLLFSASVNVPAGEILGETTHFVTFS